MRGQMMDTQLTLPWLLRRCETYFPEKEIVSRMPDRSFHRYGYADMARRAKQLGVALQRLGLEPGDRVATLCWNHYAHYEAYLGLPCSGFVLHTLNLRLHPNDLAYIAAHAGDGDLVLVIVGGKDGYVERDGHAVTEEDIARRQAISKGWA